MRRTPEWMVKSRRWEPWKKGRKTQTLIQYFGSAKINFFSYLEWVLLFRYALNWSIGAAPLLDMRATESTMVIKIVFLLFLSTYLNGSDRLGLVCFIRSVPQWDKAFSWVTSAANLIGNRTFSFSLNEKIFVCFSRFWNDKASKTIASKQEICFIRSTESEKTTIHCRTPQLTQAVQKLRFFTDSLRSNVIRKSHPVCGLLFIAWSTATFNSLMMLSLGVKLNFFTFFFWYHSFCVRKEKYFWFSSDGWHKVTFDRRRSTDYLTAPIKVGKAERTLP